MNKSNSEKLSELFNKFKKKISVNEAKELVEKIPQIKRNSIEDKKVEKEIDKNYLEIYSLIKLCEVTNFPYLKWNEDSKQENVGQGDGVIYDNNNNPQNIEMTNLSNAPAMKSLKKFKHHVRASQSIVDLMEGVRISEKEARDYIKGQRMLDLYIEEDLPYDCIIDVLKKKVETSYTDYWLLIPFHEPDGFECLFNEPKRKYIFSKIEEKNSDLVSKIRKMFRKIIFLPYGDGRTLPEGIKIKSFEWVEDWLAKGFPEMKKLN